jgi:hypothetical protein
LSDVESKLTDPQYQFSYLQRLGLKLICHLEGPVCTTDTGSRTTRRGW